MCVCICIRTKSQLKAEISHETVQMNKGKTLSFNNNHEITDKKKQFCYLLVICEEFIPVCEWSHLHCVSCVLHQEIWNRSGPSFHT